MAIYDGTNAPTITVSFDFGKAKYFTLGVSQLGGTDQLGTATINNWSPIPTTDVRSISIRRGRTREDQTVQPGVLTMTLDNRTSNYDPDNAASPYMWGTYTLLFAGLPVQIKATWSGTDYILYTGYVERIDTDMSLDPVAIFTCTDAMALLAKQTVSMTAPQETTDVRVGRVLDLAGWDASARSLTSSRTLVASTTSGTPLSLAEVASTSEFGRLFASRDNKIVLQPYESLFTNPFRFTLSDSRAAGTLEYDVLNSDPGSRYLTNTVSVTDGTGAVSTASNIESNARYGTFSKAVTTGLAPAVSSPSALAQLMADKNALPATRVDSVEWSMPNIDSTLWPQILQADLGDNCTVERTTVDGRIRSFTSLIESLNHDILPNSWRIQMDLSPSKRTGTFIIGTSLLGGTDTLWY